MTLLLRYPVSDFDNRRYAVRNLDREPCPTITATMRRDWEVSHDDGPEPEPMTDKPPYRVPSMAEIAAMPSNGFTVVSTFSGCGGSCLGFEMAGYRVLWASEFISAAAETYRLNHPGVILDTRDIRQVTAEEILAAIGRERGDVDVLEGSPPCAAFSTAGKREESWGQVRKYSDGEQRVDDLFFEYARIVDGIRPRVFVAENVSGLVKGKAKGYFKEILAALKAAGYRVEARLLDAQWLGVPQARQRIIFMGIRNDLDARHAWPAPLPYYYSVRDALPELLRVTGRTGPQFRRVPSELDEPMNAVVASDLVHTRYEVETRMVGGPGAVFDAKHRTYSLDDPAPTIVGGQGARSSHQVYLESDPTLGTYKGDQSVDEPSPTILTHGRLRSLCERSLPADVPPLDTGVPPEAALGRAVGDAWDHTPQGGSSSRYFSLTKPHPERPSQTVTALGGTGAAGVSHPTERRKFTIPELRRICSFPDDFRLSGTYAQQWERLGRSVPPLMMRAVAEVIRDRVLR